MLRDLISLTVFGKNIVKDLPGNDFVNTFQRSTMEAVPQ
jgi:hypothetical protein